MDSNRKAQIITFYSYKGGTGRTMALANVASVASKLVRNRGKVLVIDWDLEAPGLATYFQQQPTHGYHAPYNDDWETGQFDYRRGVLDFFSRLNDFTMNVKATSIEECKAMINSIELSNYVQRLYPFDVYYMGPGIRDNLYESRLTSLRWDALYERAPSLFTAFAEKLADEFDYVFIDSRTGFNDTSSVCTMLMPEKLVVVFTPNSQSLTGIAALVRRATKIRRQSSDMRPLAIFPLPSRIDITEPKLRDQWRFGRRKSGALGYQPLFELLFSEEYGLGRCDLNEYFDEVQVQYSPAYSYGEEIAVIDERADRLSLARSYESFGKRLFELSAPWETFGDAAADKSLDKANRLIEMDPMFAGAYLQRASVYEELGRHRDAIEDLSRAIQRDPNSAEALYRRGMISMQLRDFERAKVDLERALRIDPKHAAALGALGEIQGQTGDLAQALEVLSMAVRVAPRDSHLVLERAKIFRRLGQLENAMREAARALELDPLQVYGYVLLGLIAMDQERFEEALEQFSRASQLDPENLLAMYLRAIALQRLERPREALEELHQTIERDGTFIPAILAAADIHQRLDDRDTALNLRQRAEMLARRSVNSGTDYAHLFDSFGDLGTFWR